MSCGKPCDCPSFRDHLLSISMQPAGPHPVELKERQWDKDLAAYKRLRQQGLQPKTNDGCAELEKHASTQQEIEMGHLFRTREDQVAAREGVERAQEMFGE